MKLSEEDLEAISGGGIETSPRDDSWMNHNETIENLSIHQLFSVLDNISLPVSILEKNPKAIELIVNCYSQCF